MSKRWSLTITLIHNQCQFRPILATKLTGRLPYQKWRRQANSRTPLLKNLLRWLSLDSNHSNASSIAGTTTVQIFREANSNLLAIFRPVVTHSLRKRQKFLDFISSPMHVASRRRMPWTRWRRSKYLVADAYVLFGDYLLAINNLGRSWNWSSTAARESVVKKRHDWCRRETDRWHKQTVQWKKNRRSNMK